MNGISLVVPLHNEAEIIVPQVEKCIDFLENEPCIHDFEILLCGNGCTDNTYEIALKLALNDSRIKAFDNRAQGIGVGLKDGIWNSGSFEFAMFYAIDLPFGLNIISESMAAISDCDLVVGSKAHPNSRVKRSIARKLLTFAYSMALKGFFSLDVKDPQGSLLWRKDAMDKILPALTADTAFLETQIAIYFQAADYRIKEIPVIFESEMRKTKIAFVKEARRIVPEILLEKKRYFEKREKILKNSVKS